MTTNEDCAAHLALKKRFEVGQIWLCRNGTKRLILSTTKPGEWPIVTCYPHGGALGERTTDGKISTKHGHDEDLVSLYTPKKTKDIWIVMYVDLKGEPVTYSMSVEVKANTWIAVNVGYKLLAIKKVTVTEGEGIDWERE